MKRFTSCMMMVAVIVSIMSTPIYAIADASLGRSATVEGHVFLGGKHLEIGVNKKGFFGTKISSSSLSPDGFHPIGYNGDIGMQTDADGFDQGDAPTTGDIFLPGTRLEGYSIGYTIDSTQTYSSNSEYDTTNMMNSIATTDTSTEDTVSATTVGTTNDSVIEMTQVVSFKADSKFYKIDVTLENISEDVLTDVRYLRYMDAEPDYDLHGTFSAYDAVTSNPNESTNEAIVYAKGPTTMEPVLYYANDARARAAVYNFSGTFNPYLETFYQEDGSAMLKTESLRAGMISLAYGLGDFQPGESTNFAIYISLDENIEEGLGSIEDEVVVESDDAKLSSLSINQGSLSPSFDANVTSYTVDVDNAVDSVSLIPVTSDENATVTVNNSPVISGTTSGAISLDVGNNVINTTVTAEDGTEKTYSITVTRESLSDVAFLSSLTLQDADSVLIEYTPDFDMNITSYAVDVDNAVDSVSLIPVTLDENATVTVNDSPVISGTTSGAISLNVGSNVINTKVTAEDGTEKTYSITVTRERLSDVASLSALTLQNLDSVLIEYTPDFDMNVTSYEAWVSNRTATVQVIPVTTGPGITIDVQGTNVTSGQESQNIELTVGDTNINILVTAEDGMTTTNYTLTVHRATASRSSNNNTSQEEPEGTDVIINGVSRSAGTESQTEEDGREVFRLDIDEEVLTNQMNLLYDQGQTNRIEMPIRSNRADVVVAELNGAIIKEMDEKTFELQISNEGITYTIPAKEFSIDDVASNLNVQTDELEDIKIEIKMTKPTQEELDLYESIVSENADMLVVLPMNFEIIADVEYADGTQRTEYINQFTNYVSRTFTIPDDVDPESITTGIVFNPDGSYEHVPTEVYEVDGVWYARINSLTNSVYSVIQNGTMFDLIQGHWAQTAVNDFASRQIIDNPLTFNPDVKINRAEFVHYITKALGIYRDIEVEEIYSDVSMDSPYAQSIFIASDYGIVQGHGDKMFAPLDSLTREEAMVIIDRAMQMVDMEVQETNQTIMFNDSQAISSWARESVETVVDANIFNGKPGNMLDPQGSLTHAEAITALRNMLIESNLINQ